jgi:hypothetical protein
MTDSHLFSIALKIHFKSYLFWFVQAYQFMKGVLNSFPILSLGNIFFCFLFVGNLFNTELLTVISKYLRMFISVENNTL